MKSVLYLLIIGGTAIGLGIVFFTYFRPMIVERGCAEIAQKSTGIFKNQNNLDPQFQYDGVKNRCLEDALK